MTKSKKIILGILITLFVLVMFFVIFDLTKGFDDAVYKVLINMRSDNLDSFFKFITKFANTKTIILLVSIILIINRNKEGITVTSLTLFSVSAMTILKAIIKRDRPSHLRLIKESNYSFPSGHAMISICVYGYLLYLAYTKINNKIIKYLVSIGLLLLIILIGLSRIYLGVHYPSDIIGGYLLALIILIIVIEKSKAFSIRGE